MEIVLVVDCLWLSCGLHDWHVIFFFACLLLLFGLFVYTSCSPCNFRHTPKKANAVEKVLKETEKSVMQTFEFLNEQYEGEEEENLR